MRALLLALLLLGCDAPTEPLDGVLAECSPCTEGRVRMWVPGEAPQARVGDDALEAEVAAVHGGHRVVVDAPVGELSLRRGNAVWSVSVGLAQTHASLERIGDERTAETRAAVQRALETASGSEAAALTSRLGRIALSLGDDEAAVEHLSEGARLHLALDEHADAVLDAVAQAWVLQRRLWRYDDALASLAAVEDAFDHAPIPAARARHRRGVILAQLGRAREGEREIAAAQGVAEKLGETQLVGQAGIVRAELLHELGRPAAARAALAEVESGLEGCLRGDHANTRAWLNLLDAEQGARLDMSLFEAAERAYAECSTEQRANAALNTALAHLHRGALTDAQEALTRAEGGGALVGAWRLDYEARAALRDDPTAALTSYTTLARRARLAGVLGLEWRGELGRGRALEKLSRWDDAIAAYEAAELVLDREAAALTLGSASGFVGARWHSAARLAAILLEREPERGLQVLRRARLRALPRRASTERRRSYDEAHRVQITDAGDAWSLPADELDAYEQSRSEQLERLHRVIDEAFDTQQVEPRPVGDDELLVVVFPHPHGRLVVAQRDGRIRGEVGPETVWPGFVSEWAQGATRARVVGAGAHAFDRPPLTIPVVHSLDVDRSPSARSRGALTVVDPTGNLRGARAEQSVFEGSLTLHEADATHAAVTRRLAEVDAFHYAGHASADEGLDAQLRLFDAPLMAADVLALTSVPRRVLLNGCESAGGQGLVPIGIAQAFVIAGSEMVVGSIAPVDDAAAAAIAEQIRGASWDAALLPNSGADPAHDYRIFVP